MTADDPTRGVSVRVTRPDAVLAGTWWLPIDQDPIATLLMVPGSGPSDRHNDTFFPPIREHLRANGIAVASFDRRGVGESTGDWTTQGIGDLADDVVACAQHLRERNMAGAGPIGLFGHSQGGWIVLEAGVRAPWVGFVITSSGPGVSPARQDRFAVLEALRAKDVDAAELGRVTWAYDWMLDEVRRGDSLATFERRLEEGENVDRADVLRRHGLVSDNPTEWSVYQRLMDHDPRPAMQALRCPVLALFGEQDRLVAVDESVAIYRETVTGAALTVRVFARADHRVRVGDPKRMAPGYLELLTDWIRSVLDGMPS